MLIISLILSTAISISALPIIEEGNVETPPIVTISPRFSYLRSFIFSPKDNLCMTPECVMAAGRMLANMNKSADPCVDFYEYACGNYKMNEEIPAGQFGMSPFNKVHLLKQKRLRALLEEPAPLPSSSPSSLTPWQKVRKYYNACNNQTAIELNGIAKLRAMVREMGGFMLTPLRNGSALGRNLIFQNWTLENLLAKRNEYSTAGFFALGIGPDDKDALTNILQVDQGGLGLGSNSRDFYVNISIEANPTMRVYAHMLEVFSAALVGPQNVRRSCIFDVIEFEKRIAEIMTAKDQRRDMFKLYNKVNVGWLQDNAPFLDWTFFLNSLFSPANITIDENEPVLVYAVNYIRKLSFLMRDYLKDDRGKQIIQNYIIFQVMLEYAPDFGSIFRDAKNDFESAYGGKSGKLEHWLDCLNDLESEIGFPLSAVFIERHFGKENKILAENLIRDIIPAFRRRMSQAEWMIEDDKKMALEKLDAMNFNVAFPDWLFNDTFMSDFYTDFTVTDDYASNVISAFRFLQNRSLRDLRKPVDSSRWKLTPHTVNAYYDPSHNKFIVPTGILAEPFFYANQDIPLALNYGAAGAVAAHEIGHSVDDTGRQYDKNGSLRDWWQSETVEKFNNLTRCLVDQYSHYSYYNMSVRGLQTLGENIADNGGVKTAFEAFRKIQRINSKAKRRLVGVDATSDQLFFISYAQVWCSVSPETIVRLGIMVDSHAPNPARVNGPLSNLPEFSEAFNCKIKTPMNPVEKCSVW